MKMRPAAMKVAVLALMVTLSAAIVVHAQNASLLYEVDTSWPKALPGKWVLGPVGAACVDAQDHVFILNRQAVLDVDLDAGEKAPPVIEFDPMGNVVNSWPTETFTDTLIDSFHACHVDAENNVWVLSTESGMVRKYTHDGSKMLLQIGKSDVVDSSDGTPKGKPLNSDSAQFFAPADVNVDRRTGEVYVDDGDGGGNHRIAIMDRSGTFLRQWRPEGVASIHCMALANDGSVYLCDRDKNRLLVYDRAGTLQRSIDIPWQAHTPIGAGDTKRQSGSSGSAVSIALSRDANQRLMYVINQNNARVEVLDRHSGKDLTNFGRSGHFPGQFDQPLSIAVDSKGNVYVTENRGKRVQKFTMRN